MILSDGDILRRLEQGDLVVEPLEDVDLQVQPASVDLRLGREFLEFQHANIPCIHPTSEREVDEYVEERVVDEDAGEEFLGPQSVTGHLDGYANFDENPEVFTFTLGAAVYVDDVRPRSGGFTVWPGSHRVAAAYFEDHALETVGGKPNNSQVPAVGEAAGEWDYDDLLWNQYDPYEVSGPAGTVVLWHSKLTHNAGINVGEDVRMAAITRFAREDQQEIRRDDAETLFEYWPAMAGVPLVEGGESIASSED